MTEISEKENEPQNRDLHRPQATVPSQQESKVTEHTCVKTAGFFFKSNNLLLIEECFYIIFFTVLFSGLSVYKK